MVGIESTFSVGVEIVVQTNNDADMDVETENNMQQIVFNVEARADISVEQL